MRRRSASTRFQAFAAAGFGGVAGGTTAGEYVTTRAAASLSTIYRCIGLISDLIGNAPRRAVRVDPLTGARRLDTTSATAAVLADLAVEELLRGGFKRISPCPESAEASDGVNGRTETVLRRVGARVPEPGACAVACAGSHWTTANYRELPPN